MRQEDPRAHRQGAREVRRRLRAPAATARELGEQLFDIIEPFADYAFNKTHAYGYGLVAYQTAYLKAHYPVEYLAALLTSVKANLDKAAVYLAECRDRGIEVLVPDVNLPPVRLRAGARRRRPIPFGLSAVRNVGEGLVGLIVEERDANGPFADFYDFCERVDPSVLNKRTIESLIKAGAFDSLGHPRKGLLVVFEQIIDQTLARRRERDLGVMSLFGDRPERRRRSGRRSRRLDERVPIPDLEFDKAQRLAFEKEMLGLYVSDHPLMGVTEARCAGAPTARSPSCARPTRAACGRAGAWSPALQRKWTKKGDLMAVFTLEDLQSAIEVMVFPKTMTEHGHKLADDAVVVVRGRVDKRDDQPKLIAFEIEVVEALSRVGAAAPHPADRPGCHRRAWWPGSSGCSRSTRASRRCSSTSGERRCCACPTSSASTSPAGWSASSACCWARRRSG